MEDEQSPDDQSIIGTHSSTVPRYDPPDWVSTDLLETELFNAIMEDTPGCTDEDIDNYDDSLDEFPDEEDDEEDEEEKRQSTFTLLVEMRPLLGELLGGPPASNLVQIESGTSDAAQATSGADAKTQRIEVLKGESMQGDLVWRSTIDHRYTVRVLRIAPYLGELSIHEESEGDQVIHKEVVALIFDALLGPDVADFGEWQRIAIEFLDTRKTLSR
jgi:hypothetical protein